MGEDKDWLERLDARIDWRAEKRRIEEELANLDKTAIYLEPEELEKRRRILEEEMFFVDQKIKEGAKWLRR